MKTVTDAGLAAAAADGVRHQRAADRHRAGQPEGHRRLRRPGQARPEGRRLRPAGALRRRHGEGRAGHRRDIKPVSEEPDVKSTLGKVTTGDADAGLVYVTDVNAQKGKVTGVTFPEAKQA